MIAIKTVNLRKCYRDVVAVDDLSLEVQQGELFALLGVNGAGKTTTIKMLSCLSEPTRGDAYLLGKSIINKPNEVKSIIAVSPQETAVAPASRNSTASSPLQMPPIPMMGSFTAFAT